MLYTCHQNSDENNWSLRLCDAIPLKYFPFFQPFLPSPLPQGQWNSYSPQVKAQRWMSALKAAQEESFLYSNGHYFQHINFKNGNVAIVLMNYSHWKLCQICKHFECLSNYSLQLYHKECLGVCYAIFTLALGISCMDSNSVIFILLNQTFCIALSLGIMLVGLLSYC